MCSQIVNNETFFTEKQEYKIRIFNDTFHFNKCKNLFAKNDWY